MQKRSLITVLATLLLSTTMMFSQVSGNPHGQTSLPVAVTGTVAPTTPTGPLSSIGAANLTGTFNINHFAVQNGALVAVGNLVGTLTTATGQILQTLVVNNVTAAVTPSAACPVLSLTLGPLNLNLLGLVVNTNQINVNIVAQPGSGNLLGNLLCDVSGLLSGGNLGAIANALNGILAGLGL